MSDKPDLRGVAVGVPGPLAVYADELEDAGVNVIRYGPDDFKRAVAFFVDAVAKEKISVNHDAELNEAQACAVRWPKDAKKGWVWGWADPSHNLSSLWAATMAVHQALLIPEEPEREFWIG